MNNAQKGYQRDREVVALVRRLGVANTDQVRALLFRMPAGLRKTQDRLKVLVSRGEVNRCRLSPNDPYVYYTGRRPGQLEHKVMVSWAYCYLTAGLASWERLEEWRREDVCRDLRSDAVAGITNRLAGGSRYTFVEAEHSDNPFDKVSIYNRLYESQAYLSAWWTENARRFPAVLVVTHSEGRKREIERRVKRENTNGLRFEVKTVEEVRRRVGTAGLAVCPDSLGGRSGLAVGVST